jgi:replication factor C subunit 3/5
MLFYGPSGAGKKTRIAATMNELFGSGVEKVGCLFLHVSHLLEGIVPVCSLKSIKGCFLRHHGRNWMSTWSRVTITSSLRRGSYHTSARIRSTVGLIVLPCSEVGNYDRVVIQEILKEIAQTQQVDVSAKQRFKGASQFPSAVRDSG